MDGDHEACHPADRLPDREDFPQCRGRHPGPIRSAARTMKIKKIPPAKSRCLSKTPSKLRCAPSHMHSLVLCIETDDGRTGYGEAPATAVITGDTIDSMRAGSRCWHPMLIGRDLADFNACIQVIAKGVVHHEPESCTGNGAVRFACTVFGMPLYRLLGGGTPRLETDVTISVNDTAAMVADCVKAVDEGFDALKVKVGGRTWREDVDTTIAIHNAIGPNVSIRLDANQGWTRKHALKVLRALGRPVSRSNSSNSR